ncbi:MAG TPA: hypothetical protein VFU89_07805 [Rhabdochlamydiaceae bacterium]|nr:hypothetical protein [Rhabdochlamydiaceae bacterium]
MAVQALNFNFTGLIEKPDLISCKNLFVSQAPALQGKPLCEYLTKLDEEEYRLVSAENQELTPEVSDSWDNRVVSVVLLFFVVYGITMLFYEKLGLPDITIHTPYKVAFYVVGVVAFIISSCITQFGYAPMHRQFALEEKVHQIDESRKQRLKEKFKAVRAEYRKLKEAPSSLAQKTPQQIELRDAKRFLQDQIESIHTIQSKR